MSKGLFGDMFDFNGDGDLNFVERAAEFTFVQHLMEEDEEDEEYTEDPEDAVDDSRTELECEGFDYDELSLMDEYERAEALEDAGLDPDDYEFD